MAGQRKIRIIINVFPKNRNREGFLCPRASGTREFCLKEFGSMSVPASLLQERDFLQSICFQCVWVEKSDLVYKVNKEKYDGLTLHDVDCHHEHIQLTSYN